MLRTMNRPLTGMRSVALTGNIASGKSAVADKKAQRGATIIDADELARDAVEPASPALEAIVERTSRTATSIAQPCARRFFTTAQSSMR